MSESVPKGAAGGSSRLARPPHRTLGCIQSSYLPWQGYFHVIQRSDVFVFHDDIQYTKQDWRNRNRVRSAAGVKWLTVPVRRESTRGTIEAVRISNDRNWRRKHWLMIEGSYRRAPHFAAYRDILLEAYDRKWERLSELNIFLIRRLSRALGIRTEFVHSSDLGIQGRKTDRLVQMCAKLRASRYLSGPSARAYIEPAKFDRLGVALEYMTYEYPPYPQIHGGFAAGMSVIDLLFNCGPDSGRYVWGDDRAG